MLQRFAASRVSMRARLLLSQRQRPRVECKGIVMAFINWQDKAAPREASETARFLCVTSVLALATLPFALCAALTIWGS
jgi:hypothetical protein